MQIRLANRQDEPEIRTLVSQRRAKMGLFDVEPAGRDSDLSNVDAKYFWYDGMFLVAETEGVLVGIIGTRRGEAADSLELMRLQCVGTEAPTAARRLLETAIFFGKNMEYKQLVCHRNDANVDRPLLDSLSLGFEGTDTLTLKLPDSER